GSRCAEGGSVRRRRGRAARQGWRRPRIVSCAAFCPGSSKIFPLPRLDLVELQRFVVLLEAQHAGAHRARVAIAPESGERFAYRVSRRPPREPGVNRDAEAKPPDSFRVGGVELPSPVHVHEARRRPLPPPPLPPL